MVIVFVLAYAIIKYAINHKNDASSIVMDRLDLQGNPIPNIDEFAKHYNPRLSYKTCYWYHVEVNNTHKQKPAINCVVYLELLKQIIYYRNFFRNVN